MDMVKWGIVGTGKIATSFVEDFAHVENGVVAAVASRNLDRAEQFCVKHGLSKAFGSYQDLFDDETIEAVYIATPHSEHLQNTLDALRGDKAVLCEKPLTTGLKQAEEVIEYANSSRNYLMEGMWTYFLPAIRKAQEWVQEGKIGAVRHIRADFGFTPPYQPKARLYNPELAGGALWDIGIYPIAFAWLFTQQMPQEMSVVSKKAPTGVEDDISILFEYPEVTATMNASFRSRFPNEGYIIGENAYIKLPSFWKAKECLLYQDEECVDHFIDPSKSKGYSFEITAMR